MTPTAKTKQANISLNYDPLINAIREFAVAEVEPDWLPQGPGE